MATDQTTGKKKVSILGGGPGALAAAFWLTDKPGWQERYEVTLYQLGWRLGGKAATGRQAEHNQRIIEHGVHALFGWYDNIFRTIQKTYEELGRRPGVDPIATWEEAFEPSDEYNFPEYKNGEWLAWILSVKVPPGTPGEGPSPNVWQGVMRVIGMMTDGLVGAHQSACQHETGLRYQLQHALLVLLSWAIKIVLLPLSLLSHVVAGQHLVSRSWMVGLVELVLRPVLYLPVKLISRVSETNTLVRRVWISLQIGLALLRGIFVDRVVERGWASINDYELPDWLQKHGASPAASDPKQCSLIRAFYDGLQSYKDGDPDQPTLAAGDGLQIILLGMTACKGHAIWRFKAGPGDSAWAPMYEVLSRRGVRFEFFHRTKRLRVSDDRKSIVAVELVRQATVKDGAYDPLIRVKNLPSWPDEALYDQLVEGQQLRQRGINLETPFSWRDWQDPGEVVLEKGKDFDELICGLNLGSLRPFLDDRGVGHELFDCNQRWKEMNDIMQDTTCLAAQLWLTPSAKEMGWEHQQPLMAGFIQPQASLDDEVQRAVFEDWPEGAMPGTELDLCGTLNTAALPPPESPNYVDEANEFVKKKTIECLEGAFGYMFPEGAQKESVAIDWSLLMAPAEAMGVERFEHQYWIAHLAPASRGIMSVPKSSAKRIPPDDTGFDNFYIVGDWVDNPINIKSMEAATMTGMKVSKTLTGHPATIARWEG